MRGARFLTGCWRWTVALAATIGFTNLSSAADGGDVSDRAAAAMLKAARFFHEHVASHGGYVYQYSTDLKLREGEGEAPPNVIWVQPPGTPAVGMAFLDAYDATGDMYYLTAARDAAEALIQGQLRSGGWNAMIEFDPELRKNYNYRVDPYRKSKSFTKGRDMTSLDDDKSQSACQFLMRLDQTLDHKDSVIHEAILYALDHLVAAQHDNGAFPQAFSGEPKKDPDPTRAASFPKSWPRKYPGGDYWLFYTFNDNAMADTLGVMLEAWRVYGDSRYLASAIACGDFMLRAQLPEPQPAWAQQYNFDMQPAWARKFEPPSISGLESQGVLRALLSLYVATGDDRYLEPFPRALAYLKRSLRDDGSLARFYELETNKPLYLTKDYQLTYSDADMPTHYGFIVDAKLDEIERLYREVKASPPSQSSPTSPTAKKPVRAPSAARTAEVERIIAAQDERGAWVEPGGMRYVRAGKDSPVIASKTFIANLRELATFVAATRASN